MRQGTLISTVLCAALAFVPRSQLDAQNPMRPAVASAIERARTLLDNGNGSAARNTMDSLVTALQPGTPEFAEVLNWRGAMAENLADAERDWRRLIVESPLNVRAGDALLRLAELEALRGKQESARQYAERLLLEHAESAGKPRAQLLVARSWFAENNSSNGCAALAAMPAAELIGEVKLQLDELNARCTPPGGANATITAGNSAGNSAGNTAARNTASGNSATGNTAAGNTARNTNTGTAAANTTAAGARFSVQLAAYARKADADDMVKRLAGLNIDARVDGTENPFRVRTGYFRTRAEANTVLQSYIKRGLNGFIAELEP